MDTSTRIELMENINKVDTINLTSKEYRLQSPLEINSPIKIIGNSSVIKGTIIVSSNVYFSNISFENTDTIFFVDNSAKVTFDNCNFSGNNDGRAIYMVPYSDCELSILRSKFKNFNITIDLNDGNKIECLEENQFLSCKIVIDNVNKESVLNYESIEKNNHYFSKEDIFINFYKRYKPKESIYYIATKLSHSNNYARVIGSGMLGKIDTSNVIANSTDELYDILKECENCKNVFLTNSVYVAPIIINKPVAIIGDENTRLRSNFAYPENTGIIINSSYVVVENIVIDGGKNESFSYGLKCDMENATYITIRNFKISNISNSGIVFNSKWNKKVNVENCNISHIKNKSGICAVGNMNIIGNVLTNINVAISVKGVSKIYFSNNSINLCNIAIGCPQETLERLEILDCRFKTEKILLTS